MLESWFSSRHEHIFRFYHTLSTTLNKFRGSKSSWGTSVETQLLVMINGEKQTWNLSEKALIPYYNCCAIYIFKQLVLNNIRSKRSMEIQTEQNKPHRKRMSIAQEFTISFTLIKSGVTIVYIKEEFECIREKFESTNWMWLYLTD